MNREIKYPNQEVQWVRYLNRYYVQVNGLLLEIDGQNVKIIERKLDRKNQIR